VRALEISDEEVAVFYVFVFISLFTCIYFEFPSLKIVFKLVELLKSSNKKKQKKTIIKLFPQNQSEKGTPNICAHSMAFTWQ
jgi:hypothetical protein